MNNNPLRTGCLESLTKKIKRMCIDVDVVCTVKDRRYHFTAKILYKRNYQNITKIAKEEINSAPLPYARIAHGNVVRKWNA
jgi:hypothetical protein